MEHRSEDLSRLLEAARSAPKDEGLLKLIVLRLPGSGRSLPERAALVPGSGIEGDRWGLKTERSPSSEVSMMNARFIEAAAGSVERMSLSGDNLLVDMDISRSNLPTGARLRVGSAVLELTDHPHHGCSKFERHYGKSVRELVDSPEGCALRLRGVYARVVEGGEVRCGDVVSVSSREPQPSEGRLRPA
jgi:MOSC domain-containing protein YiiM